MAQSGAAEKADAVIIGAGLGGLCAAAKLKEAGLERIVVLEKARGLGGVWRENRYPNVACDTPIDLYAFSFFPGRKWSTNFAPGEEILEYLEEFAATYGIAPLISFGVEASGAFWDEECATWRVEARDGRAWESRYLVWAGGLLSRPSVPRLPGLDQFQGQMLHTTEWSDAVGLDGKSVAIVGSGATAIQVVPYAAEHAEKLYAFVRTPSYVLPKPDLFFSVEDRDSPAFADGQKERREEWFRLFEMIAMARFPVNDEIIARQEAQWREHFDKVIKDPQLREILTPKYRFGCKRPLFSNAYYPAMNRPNVTAIGEGAARLGSNCIIDGQGREYPVDVIIWATGFSPTDMLGGLEIVGRNGRELAAFWRDIPEAYYGTFVKGFPNLFLMNGPNVSGASATDFIESQLRLIAEAIRLAERKGATTIAVGDETHDSFNRKIQALTEDSVLVRGNCASWYRVGGTGKVFTHWPGTIAAFRAEIAREALAGLEFDRPAVRPNAAAGR